MKYTIQIQNRHYTEWRIKGVNATEDVELDLQINPFENHLFSGDIFYCNKRKSDNIKDKFEESCKIERIESPIRTAECIPGVLIVEDNKTYGREDKGSKKGRLLYKFIPDDNGLPIFLVPYEIKNMEFSKVFKNMYATIRYDDWSAKHPIGKLLNVIGTVDAIENYCEYQLTCKNLNLSIREFERNTKAKIAGKSDDQLADEIVGHFSSDNIISDRTDKSWYIYSIDPLGSKDFDDAFGVKYLDNGVKLVSIYISNVVLYMDYLQLWGQFSGRVSTMYLPDKKRPMIPLQLSDDFCSLKAGRKRIAFTMDISIQNDSIIDVQFSNSLVRLTKNYVYEEPDLLSSRHYSDLVKALPILTQNYVHEDSHELVAALMIYMNHHCGQNLKHYGHGILRTAAETVATPLTANLPSNVQQFVKLWHTTSGAYIDCSDTTLETTHMPLGLDVYLHITSPIRRLVDILNMIQFHHLMGFHKLSNEASQFYDNWITSIERINEKTHLIRKVQNECLLLDICSKDEGLMDKLFDGYVLDQCSEHKYEVYIPELKMTTRIKSEYAVELYSKVSCRLFVFNDEERIRRKIRCQIVT